MLVPIRRGLFELLSSNFAASASLVFHGLNISTPAAAAAFRLVKVTMSLFPSRRRDPSSVLVQKVLIAPCSTSNAPPTSPSTTTTHPWTSAAVLGKHPQWQDGSRLKTGPALVPPAAPTHSSGQSSSLS